MMGAFSRSKGKREELGLCMYLRDRGYEARRVPLSGASEGYKHDVIGTKEGVEYSFEMKSRNSSFKTFYALYYKHKFKDENVMRFTINGEAITLGTEIDEVKSRGDVFYRMDADFDAKVFRRVLALDKLRAGADYLCIKDNGRPRLFIKFWR